MHASSLHSVIVRANACQKSDTSDTIWRSCQSLVFSSPHVVSRDTHEIQYTHEMHDSISLYWSFFGDAGHRDRIGIELDICVGRARLVLPITRVCTVCVTIVNRPEFVRAIAMTHHSDSEPVWGLLLHFAFSEKN